MESLPPINEDMSYNSESSYEEQECKRRCAEKVALLAVLRKELLQIQGASKKALSQ
jgi:hypothetical protein